MCGTAWAPSTSDTAPAARARAAISATGMIVPSTFETWVNATMPHVAARELRVELLQRELAALVDLQVAQLRAALAAEHLPGDDVRVVLHLRDQHRVAGPTFARPSRSRDPRRRRRG